MPVDYKDFVIEILSDEAVLRAERIASLEAEVISYRMLAQEGIHALHHLTVAHDRLRESHYRLIDEYRALRVQILHKAAA